MTARLYTAWDEGAPRITDREFAGDQVRAVIRACLVDGYGDKPPAGWRVGAYGDLSSAEVAPLYGAALPAVVPFYLPPYDLEEYADKLFLAFGEGYQVEYTRELASESVYESGVGAAWMLIADAERVLMLLAPASPVNAPVEEMRWETLFFAGAMAGTDPASEWRVGALMGSRWDRSGDVYSIEESVFTDHDGLIARGDELWWCHGMGGNGYELESGPERLVSGGEPLAYAPRFSLEYRMDALNAAAEAARNAAGGSVYFSGVAGRIPWLSIYIPSIKDTTQPDSHADLGDGQIYLRRFDDTRGYVLDLSGVET